MSFNSDHHNRRSIRLQGHDYRQAGTYFITICTHQRECLFGSVIAEDVQYSPFGMIARQELEKIAALRANVVLDTFVIMPNHVHALIQLIVTPQDRAVNQFAKPISGSIAAIIGVYKSQVTRQINLLRNLDSTLVWQRGFYEHIVRNEHSLNQIRAYILNNPLKWAADLDNPQNWK